MSRRTYALIGCVLSASCIALCIFAGIIIKPKVNDLLGAFVPNSTATSEPIHESTTPEVVPPEALAATPAPHSTVSPKIPFPTPYSPTALYHVSLDESYDIETYSVSGSAPQEIRRDLDRKGVIDQVSRNRFDAETRWQLDGNWNWQQSNHGCRLSEATLSLKVTLVLPTLDVSPSLPESVLQGWNAYIIKLKMHESEHIRLDVSLARKLRDDFAVFPGASDCTILRSQLQARYDSTLIAIKNQNIQYDILTDHGAKQGAVYP